MIRKLISFAALLVVGIVVYNLFFGDSEEKAQSRTIIKQTGSLVGSAWDLLKAEKDKFDAGKYDQALDKLGDAYGAIRKQAEFVDEKVMRRLGELEDRKAALEKELQEIEDAEAQHKQAPVTKKGVSAKQTELDSAKNAAQQRKKEELMRDLDKLMNDTDRLIKEADQE